MQAQGLLWVVFICVEASGLTSLFRYALADGSQLRARMSEMGSRIRQLEDALAIFQSAISSEPHPLLRDELLTINFGTDHSEDSALNHEDSRDENDTVDALGILTIGDRGSKYYGPSAGTEVCQLSS